MKTFKGIASVASFVYYPLFSLSLGFILGIIVNEYFKLPLFLAFFLSSVFLITYMIFKEYLILMLCIFLFAFTFGCIRYDNYFHFPENHITNYLEEELYLRTQIVTESNESTRHKRYIGKILEINKKEGEGLLLINANKYSDIRLGDVLAFNSVIESPPEFEEFNYGEYLRTQNIYAVAEVMEFEKISRVETVSTYISDLRNNISHKVKTQFHEPHASLLLGILIGTREEFTEEFNDSLQITGTNHIIAVSGYNIMILITIIMKLSGLVHRNTALLLSTLLVTIFMFLVGFENTPALRAAIVGYSLVFSFFIGRKGGLISFLPLSAALLIYLNPLAFKTISFQLSYAATIGIVALASKIEYLLKILPEIIKSELAPTISAILFTSSIIIFNFQTFSSLAPIVNILVLPVVPIIMLLGAISIPLMYAGEPLSEISNAITFLGIDYMVTIIEYFGNFSFSLFEIQQPGFISLAILCVCIFILLRIAGERKNV